MLDSSDDEQLPLDFIRECILLGRRWRVRADERVKDRGITYARLIVLWWVRELPDDTSQRELADIVGIEGPTLVRQLHALEALQLIERVPSSTDRRAKRLQLTAEGLALVEDLRQMSLEMSREYFARLDRRRLPSAIRLVRQARDAMD